MTSKQLKKTIEETRKQLFPNQTLCLIEFDDGSDTNEWIPNEVLSDQSISSVEWWHENIGMVDSISVMQGKRKALRVTPISPKG